MYAIPCVTVALISFSVVYIFRHGRTYFQMLEEFMNSNDETLLRKINRLEDVSIMLIASCTILTLVSLNILTHANQHSN